MFEKFTEKAVNVLTTAQNEALKMGHAEVYPEHLLLGLVTQKTCLSTKLLSFSGVRQEKLYEVILKKLADKPQNNSEKIIFSNELKNTLKGAFDIAKELNNSYILTEHLFLGLLKNKNSKVSEILAEFSFDIKKNMLTICKFLNKKKKIDTTNYHPENTAATEISSPYGNGFLGFEEMNKSPILEKAAAKLSTSEYEILGTEQILQSLLEEVPNNQQLAGLLDSIGLNAETFNKKLTEIKNRKDEFEGKQIIFTPNAFKTMVLALETAKELGSVILAPEHILLGLLKAKQGIAYKIIENLGINTTELGEKIVKPIERQMPETLTILRLAKQETRRLGKNVVGSEMILLGILGEGAGIGARVLADLGITIRDVRLEIEKIVGFGDAYSETQVSFTYRAKKIIEKAWELAKKYNCAKINSEHLLEAITTIPNSIAMRVLTNVGTDVVEIKQGIIKLLKDDTAN